MSTPVSSGGIANRSEDLPDELLEAIATATRPTEAARYDDKVG